MPETISAVAPIKKWNIVWQPQTKTVHEFIPIQLFTCLNKFIVVQKLQPFRYISVINNIQKQTKTSEKDGNITSAYIT
jgi:hypothetical protein